MRIIFLGTNGWYDTNTGNSICTLIETDESYLILDAGNGIYKLDQYIPEKTEKSVHLFISHVHLDHIIGMHTFNKFKFLQTMQIYGPKGIKKDLTLIINSPYTVPLPKLSFPVEVTELSEGKHNLPYPAECRHLFHSSLCMGFRFELDRKILAYCPDTGMCDNAFILARNADLLITECAFRPGQISTEWPHLNPETAAHIAKEAKAEKLVLTHFDADIYRSLKERKFAESKARETFRNTIAAEDGMEIKI